MVEVKANTRDQDLLDLVLDMREYDIPYHTRVCIDKDIRVAKWYNITYKDHYIDTIVALEEQRVKPELHILGKIRNILPFSLY